VVMRVPSWRAASTRFSDFTNGLTIAMTEASRSIRWKQDVLCLNDLVKDRIEQDLLQRQAIRELKPTEPLFLNRYKTRLQDINSSIASACKRTGLPHMSHHSLRHGYATIFFDKGMSPEDVANLIGDSWRQLHESTFNGRTTRGRNSPGPSRLAVSNPETGFCTRFVQSLRRISRFPNKRQ
jgi:hypothetical protein